MSLTTPKELEQVARRLEQQPFSIPLEGRERIIADYVADCQNAAAATKRFLSGAFDRDLAYAARGYAGDLHRIVADLVMP